MASAPAIPPARGGWTTASTSVAVATDSIEAGRRTHHSALRRILHDGGPQVVYQPQLSLSRLVVDGYEALARFPDTPIRGAEQWFSRARELGMGPALEASALERALAGAGNRPAGTVLALNLSPGALTSPAIAAILPDDLTGIEIELTEHEWAPGSGRLRRPLDLLRERGARIAIDDVGVAHSGLSRVMDLAPDRIKLDRHLVQGVSTSPTQAALIRALVSLAEHTGAGVVAEGVETIDDLEALAGLDVGYAQGWVVGLPEPGFGPADPIAVASGLESLNLLLAPPRGVNRPVAGPAHGASTQIEDLLVEVASVTSLADLGALVSTCAGVLGGDTLLVSVMREDGAAIQTVPHPADPTLTRSFQLADYPITRACLESRTVMPVYRDVTGDDAEWEVLAEVGYRAALLVPVISRNRVLGLLECYRYDASAWSRRQIRSARTMAAMLGPVLDLHTRGFKGG